MAITLVGVATGTTTATVPAHVAGDLILIFAFRSATGSPTLPSGFSSIANGNGTTCSARVGYKIATGTGDTSGTWTNSAALVCHVYRASSGNTLGIGASSTIAHAATNTVNYPALTLADAGGNSWVAGFAGVNNITNTIATAPSGMTNQSHETAAANQAAGQDTNGGVSSWSSTNATTTGTAGDTTSCTVEIMLLPKGTQSNVYQHVSEASLPFADSEVGKTFLCPLPQPSGAGNCYVLGITAPNGASFTVSDSNSNSWPGTATVHANATTGNQDSWIYIVPNIASGQNTVTIAFTASTAGFSYTLTELYGIATSSPSAGSTNAPNITGPKIAAGSFTPTNNNSTGGNLLWSYWAKATEAGGTIPRRLWVASPFTLLDADVSQGTVSFDLDHASAIYLQATSAAVNPTLLAASDTDSYNGIAIALQISSGAGTAPPLTALFNNRINHFTPTSFPATGTYNLQCPTSGNLRVITSVGSPTFNALTVSDSEGNIWTSDGTTPPAFWYLANATANSNLQVYITGGGNTTNLSWRQYDISGAATSPFDSAVAANTGQTLNSVTTVTPTNLPSPSNSNGIVIANIGLGTGPGLAVTAPSGAIWALCTYPTLETDGSKLDNADIMAHYFNTASGSETWTFTITSIASNSVSGGGFIAFKAATLVTPRYKRIDVRLRR